MIPSPSATNRRALRLLLLLVTVNIVAHLPGLHDLPLGHHAWRQADTAAMARNYLEIDPGFLRPRIDYLHNATGITLGDLPLYSYLVHLAYRVFGVHEVVARSLTVLCSSAGLVASFAIGAQCVDARLGLAFAFVLAWSPVFFHYGRNIQPDVPMVALALIGVACLVGSARTRHALRTTIGGLAVALALMIKPSAIVLTVPVLVAGTTRPWRLADAKWPILACAPAIAWYALARHLHHRYEGVPYFGTFLFDIAAAPVTTLFHTLTSSSIGATVARGLRKLWLGYTGAGLLLVGLWQWQTLPANARRGLAVSIGLAALWLVVAGPVLRVHDYYALPVIPPLALIAGHGLVRLWDGGGAVRVLATALVILSPLTALQYTTTLRTGNLHPALVAIGPALDRFVPRNARIVIGPDDAPGVALYHAHRRGWAFPFIVTPERLATFIDRGATFLVSADPAFERAPPVAPHLGSLVATIGDTRVFTLH